MVHDTCPRCGSDNVGTAQDGNITCFMCGNILEIDDNLCSEVALATTGESTRACGR